VTFIDPGDQRRGRGRSRTHKPDVKAPPPPNLFDITNQPPPTPMRVTSGTSLSKRRAMALHEIRTSVPGLARFQIAERLGIPDHWLTSTIVALIQMRKIEESKTLTVVNPRSGKHCAVLVALSTAEDAAA
jgi:hypothetical protein